MFLVSHAPVYGQKAKKEREKEKKKKTMYWKHFIPLESDPEALSQLTHSFVVEKSLTFTNIYSLNDECLSWIPRPVLAVVVISPDSDIAKAPISGFGKI